MDDSTKPLTIPITYLIPRFGAGDGAVLRCKSVTVPLHFVDELSTIQDGWEPTEIPLICPIPRFGAEGDAV